MKDATIVRRLRTLEAQLRVVQAEVLGLLEREGQRHGPLPETKISER